MPGRRIGPPGARRPGFLSARGSAMIETAIAFPVILTLTLGAIQFGHVAYKTVVINSAAAAVAREVAVCNLSLSACRTAADQTGAEVLELGGMDPASFPISHRSVSSSTGIYDQVRIEGAHAFMVPFVRSYAITLVGESRMRRERR